MSTEEGFSYTDISVRRKLLILTARSGKDVGIHVDHILVVQPTYSGPGQVDGCAITINGYPEDIYVKEDLDEVKWLMETRQTYTVDDASGDRVD